MSLYNYFKRKEEEYAYERRHGLSAIYESIAEKLKETRKLDGHEVPSDFPWSDEEVSSELATQLDALQFDLQ